MRRTETPVPAIQGRPPRISGRREIWLPISITVAIGFKYNVPAYRFGCGGPNDRLISAVRLVNVLAAMAMHPPKEAPNPLLWLGYVLASAGAGMVLYFKPS